MIEKRELRKRILSVRKALPDEEVLMRSQQICDIIRGMDIYKKADDICLYMPINNEVNVLILAEDAWADGKRLWLPKTEKVEMQFISFDEDTAFSEGVYGILEPESGDVLEPDEKTLIIMPGAAFSINRDRIGYGGGYYDRFLSVHQECMTCAAAYSFQVLDSIPAEPHDRCPDVIVTEEKMLY